MRQLSLVAMRAWHCERLLYAKCICGTFSASSFIVVTTDTCFEIQAVVSESLSTPLHWKTNWQPSTCLRLTALNKIFQISYCELYFWILKDTLWIYPWTTLKQTLRHSMLTQLWRQQAIHLHVDIFICLVRILNSYECSVASTCFWWSPLESRAY
jgi:hypothetical protein